MNVEDLFNDPELCAALKEAREFIGCLRPDTTREMSKEALDSLWLLRNVVEIITLDSPTALATSLREKTKTVKFLMRDGDSSSDANLSRALWETHGCLSRLAESRLALRLTQEERYSWGYLAGMAEAVTLQDSDLLIVSFRKALAEIKELMP